ncbi:OmpA/MotB family protein [Desulfopila inferna]|uniref:OmpA/MotB family protein n=1 Tax=Desulfopila inferna TaxID=468528 RepID=UPI001963D4F2|nr:flagellar motor protein MotB [Desulfopila inferna]MBM9602979.1 OmpA family protein [Desulfopila inferna]
MSEEQQKQEEQRKQKRSSPSRGAPMWMVTYSDLVTLLLTFFVLLLSMASLDPVRFTQASSSLKDAFGMHANPAQVEFEIPVLPSPPVTKFSPMQNEMTVKIYRRIKTRIDADNLSQEIDIINKDGETIILRVKDTILFDPGETKISPQSYQLLRYIADIIRPLPLRLRIEGHTDSLSESGAELGEWDVSMARAVSVMRFLKKGALLPLDRMSAIGYGPDKPISISNTPEGRRQNRRVDFVLRAKTGMDAEESRNLETRIPF